MGCSDADTTEERTSVLVEPLTVATGVNSIATGTYHACVITSAVGAVKCWGRGEQGALGYGNKNNLGDGPNEMADNLPIVDLGTGRWARQIVAGDGHTCALLDNYTVKCWGTNGFGELGLGDTAWRGDDPLEMGDYLPVVQLGPDFTPVSLTSKGYHTCALSSAGQLKCWGRNTYGQLGIGDTDAPNGASHGDQPNEMGAQLPVINVGNNLTVQQVATGVQHTCALLSDNTVKCWGHNVSGELGKENTLDLGLTTTQMANLTAVQLGGTAKAVYAGNGVSCASFGTSTGGDGQIKCWGENGYGQLGIGSTSDRGDGPNEMGANLNNVGSVGLFPTMAAGATHTCAVLQSSSQGPLLRCWGRNTYGELGLGDTNHRGDQTGEIGTTTLSFPSGYTPKHVGAGLGGFTCATFTNQKVACWGRNNYGQLGIGSTSARGDGQNEMGSNLLVVDLGCNDGNKCNGLETGSGGVCQAGTPITIPNSGNPCTVGVCDPKTGAISFVPRAEGTSCGTNQTCDAAGNCQEPAPSVTPPAVSTTTSTSFGDSVGFIYSGPNPIQTGVTTSYMDGGRPGQISGLVYKADGTVLNNVKVTVPGFSQYGQTLTRSDGRYDLVVNGGTTVTVRLEKSGYLPVERQVDVGWDESAWVDDVVMLPTDSAVTSVSFGGSAQVAVGSTSSDGDGQRTPLVMIPSSTSATMSDGKACNVNADCTLANSTCNVTKHLCEASLSTGAVRLTEYTVGASGHERMPGPLPPNSAYTYAVELSLDEAIAANAKTVNFTNSQGLPAALPLYVNNFLNFPVGAVVPAGYYDRDKHAWVPAANGVVLKILTVGSGTVTIDSTGDNAQGTGDVALSTDERAMLAARYAVGTTLWRVPIDHFTPWDCNWPYGPPPCQGGVCPGPPNKPDEPPPPVCQGSYAGSIIDCEAQGLGEDVQVPGTPFSLGYRSTRMPGYAGRRQIQIELTGAQVHPSLTSVDVEIDIAGRRFTETVPAPPPNTTQTFTWDGYDGFGRPVIGGRTARVKVKSNYPGVYYPGNGVHPASPWVGKTMDACRCSLAA